MNKLTAAMKIGRCFGSGWVVYRASVGLRKMTGLLRRRFPTRAWDRVLLGELLRPGVPGDPAEYRRFREKARARFFFSPGQPPDQATLRRVLGEAGLKHVVAVADDFCRGRFLLFSRHVRDLGMPVNWLLNPFNRAQHHAKTHWCDYPTFSPRLGDIKEVWEASRFAGAYWLARAYAVTRDEKYPEAFWRLFESWCAANPPNMGPNWKCGQETAIRMFGWCFALYAFWNCPATTPERSAAMVRMLAIQADRIEKHIDFAISQKNNHSMSEAVGLLTVGLLFPELVDSARWADLGRSVLESDIRRQVYEDGSFVQHSMNYHRVMLHVCLWAARLCELSGDPLAPDVRRRLDRAADFLFEMLDSDTGHAPNYGANDGALVLPLAACDYRDYRPTAQAAGYLAHRRRRLSDGPWDEMLLWLFGPGALRSPLHWEGARSRRFDAGGYCTLRAGESWGMIRCHSYRDRPSHVDMLHFDLWYRGVNVLGDSGTYKYFAPEAPGLDKFFKDIQAHNCVEIGGRGPLQLVSRFIWLPWPSARIVDHWDRAFMGESDAYLRAPWHVSHRRSIKAEADHTWRIEDEISGPGMQPVALRWNLAPGDVEIDADERVTWRAGGAEMRLGIGGTEGLRVVLRSGTERGEAEGGWLSEYYRDRRRRPVIMASGHLRLPARLITEIELAPAKGS